jgi:hypothetical protein
MKRSQFTDVIRTYGSTRFSIPENAYFGYNFTDSVHETNDLTAIVTSDEFGNPVNAELITKKEVFPGADGVQLTDYGYVIDVGILNGVKRKLKPISKSSVDLSISEHDSVITGVELLVRGFDEQLTDLAMKNALDEDDRPMLYAISNGLTARNLGDSKTFNLSLARATRDAYLQVLGIERYASSESNMELLQENLINLLAEGNLSDIAQQKACEILSD